MLDYRVDGYKIRTLREAQEISVTQFAKKIGITEAAMSNIERNIKAPSAVTLKRISVRLDVTIDDLIKSEVYHNGD